MSLTIALLTLLLAGASPASAHPDGALPPDGVAAWALRDDPVQVEKTIGLYEQALAGDPANPHLLAHTAEAWSWLAGNRGQNEKAAAADYAKALGYARRCLALNPAYQAQVQAGVPARSAVQALRPEDAPCLFEAQAALSGWLDTQSLGKRIKQGATAKAWALAAAQLAPAHDRHEPLRVLGRYYAGLASYAGPDYDKAADYFDLALVGSPGNLAIRVDRAETLWVARQDAVRFRDDLRKVLAADPAALPDRAPENRRAQARAQALLDREARLFTKQALSR